MIDYRIPAIPTTYRGRRYRSRLEARWAAFFDLLGWHHEYEPCDLGSWSPDFAIWGNSPHFPTLVEVKPIDGWDRIIARKMADAAAEKQLRVLLLGLAPYFDSEWISIGWWGEPGTFEAVWDTALLGVTIDGKPDIQPNGEGYICQESMLWGACYDLDYFDAKQLWVQAANVVQWRGVDATP
jgi:hypothetical protein